jgi:hypothetical protein
LIPNQPISRCGSAIASSISFSVPLIKNLQCHQPALLGAETMPLFYLWFELSVCMLSVLGRWVWLSVGAV